MRRSRRRGARSRVWSRIAGPRAREVSLSHRAPHPGKVARTGGARDDGRRQADQGIARRRSAAGRGALLLLRGLGGQARLRVSRPESRAARRLRADHPVEFPAAHGRVETRAGARLRQHRACSSPRRRRASPRCISRRFFRKPELPRRRGEHRHRRGRNRARAGRASATSTRSRSPARPKSARCIAQVPSPAPKQEAHARTRRQGGAPSSSKTRRSIRRSKA